MLDKLVFVKGRRISTLTRRQVRRTCESASWSRCTADAYLAASQAYTDATHAEPGNKWYEHFQQGVDGDAKQYIAERLDILYIDAADRDGCDKMSEF